MKERALLALINVLIAWHALAMVAFSWPSSEAEQMVRPVFESYRRFLGLNGAWKYFAPSPWGRKTLLLSQDQSGAETKADLGSAFWQHGPQHTRLLTYLDRLGGDDADAQAGAVILTACKRGIGSLESSGAKAIGFQIVYQRGISKDEVLNGEDAWSAAHTRTKAIDPKPCDSAADALNEIAH